MKTNQIIFLLNILLISCSCSNERIYYHTFKTSDSSIKLTQWRVDSDKKGDTYIIETVDKQNRVKEIRLMENNKLYESDCYDVSIVKFEYKQDTIIQYNMIDDSSFSAGIECGEPAKIIYVLEKNLITESLKFIDYDIYLDGDFQLEPDFRIQLENEKKKNKNGIKADYNTIWGYQFSSVKYKGFLPVKKNVSFENVYLQYSENSEESPFAIQNSKFLNMKNE